MTKNQWLAFEEYKNELKKIVDDSKKLDFYNELVELQEKIIETFSEKRKTYKLENSLVYNKSYDSITESDEIKLIVVGDNPGWEEQLSKNQKYLVGQSGRIAEGYFRKNDELGIDFRKNVVITNKIPLHTGKTSDLKLLKKMASCELAKYIDDLQIKMAELTAVLHQNLIKFKEPNINNTELWMVGYSELKEKGIFSLYRDSLKAAYSDKNSIYWNDVFLFQHFSMNRFSIDLRNFSEKDDNNKKSLKENLKLLGEFHKKEIFGDIDKSF